MPQNPPKNFLLTFSLSPIEINRFEKKAPNLIKRIEAIKVAINKGYNIEIAIDPIIKIDNFKKVYKAFIEALKKENILNLPIQIGSFRMNKDFLKKLKKVHLSEIVYYPYQIKNNQARYKDEKEIIEYIKNLL